MAGLAYVGRLYVCRALARRIRAVVAAGAIVDDVGVVECRGRPGDRRVAVVAVIATGDVRWMLTACRHSVMTGSASADYLCVVDRVNGYPDVRGMAVFANIARLNMCLVLARGISAVMAAGTVASDIGVIEIRRQPASRGVAVVAVVATRNMILVLATRDDAIVAGATGPNHLCMINRVNRNPDV